MLAEKTAKGPPAAKREGSQKSAEPENLLDIQGEPLSMLALTAGIMTLFNEDRVV